MAERRLLMLEAYSTTNEPNKQQWRLTNAPGLPFHDPLDNYTWFQPAHCKPGVVDEVSKVIALMSLSGDEWRFVGVLIKGPRGSLIQLDGERYRRAIIEKVPPPEGVYTRCGAQPNAPANAQIARQGAGPGYTVYSTPS